MPSFGTFLKCECCSNPYAISSNVPSVYGLPRISIPTGTPIGANSSGVEKPPGTTTAGKPVTEPIAPFL